MGSAIPMTEKGNSKKVELEATNGSILRVDCSRLTLDSHINNTMSLNNKFQRITSLHNLCRIATLLLDSGCKASVRGKNDEGRYPSNQSPAKVTPNIMFTRIATICVEDHRPSL